MKEVIALQLGEPPRAERAQVDRCPEGGIESIAHAGEGGGIHLELGRAVVVELPGVPSDGIHPVCLDVEQDLRHALDDVGIPLRRREVESGGLDRLERVGVGADESGTEFHALI
jgi:hypothetical protein